MIRHQINPGDIGSIIYLHGKLYAKEFGYDHTFEAYVAEHLSQFARRVNPRERIWLVEADEGGDILGSIAICELSQELAQLRWFLVSPELRGQGLGRNLVEVALAFSKKCGYRMIELWTVEGLLAAKRIYLSQGFELVEENTHAVWGATHTEQKYSCKL